MAKAQWTVLQRGVGLHREELVTTKGKARIAEKLSPTGGSRFFVLVERPGQENYLKEFGTLFAARNRGEERLRGK